MNDLKEITKNIIKEYEEIKLINKLNIEKLENENLIIDNFLRDLKLIINSYEPLLKNSDVK